MSDDVGAIQNLPKKATYKMPHTVPPVPAANPADQDGAAALITELRELQAQRRFCIKSQSRCDRSTEAFIARSFGYSPDQDEKARKKVWERAASFRREVEKSGGGQSIVAQSGQGAGAPSAPIILLSAQSRQSWDNHRKQTEARMRKIVKGLPVWKWAECVRGLGELGVAIIIGEAGDLSNYAAVEKLWKRLGLAVFDGIRQQKRTNAEEALRHGYSPGRRAEVWTIGDSLFRAQWRGAKDDAVAYPLGPYGEAYEKRKARVSALNAMGAYAERAGKNAEGRLTPSHIDADARRIMTKALIEDMWKAWRAQSAATDRRGPL